MILIEGSIIDSAMIMFALVFNGTNVVVFVGRAHGIKRLQSVAGYMMNILIGPFSLLWILNLLNGSESGRLITGLPIILFIASIVFALGVSLVHPIFSTNQSKHTINILAVIMFANILRIIAFAIGNMWIILPITAIVGMILLYLGKRNLGRIE